MHGYSLFPVLNARAKKEALKVYAGDLIWATARAQYKEFKGKSLSEIRDSYINSKGRTREIEDERTGQEILDSIRDKILERRKASEPAWQTSGTS